jgi:hypothetical protein
MKKGRGRVESPALISRFQQSYYRHMAMIAQKPAVIGRLPWTKALDRM